jgi:hypothetical protein
MVTDLLTEAVATGDVRDGVSPEELAVHRLVTVTDRATARAVADGVPVVHRGRAHQQVGRSSSPIMAFDPDAGRWLESSDTELMVNSNRNWRVPSCAERVRGGSPTPLTNGSLG